MPDDTNRLAAALAPLLSRVRTDVTARRSEAGHMSWRRDEPLTEAALLRHLDGGASRGVCPIRAGQSVTQVAVLDFDDHEKTLPWAEMARAVAAVAEALELAGYEPILFRSGGGRGVHLYLLWDEPQDAYSVRAFLRDILTTCGFKPGTKGVAAGQVEVFPKQDEVAADGLGSQFILPLARASVPLAVRQLTDDEDDLT